MIISVILIVGALSGCGGGGRTDVGKVPQAGSADEFDQVEWRQPTSRDEFPGIEDSAYPDVRIDRTSALRVDSGDTRYRLWLTRSERIRGGSWRDSFDPREVCLHLFDAHLALKGFQCAPVRKIDQPGRLLMVLSGGATGAPGLRPREVVVAGVVPVGVSGVSVGADSRFVRVKVHDDAFLVVTRIHVDAIGFLRDGKIQATIAVNACQRC